MLSEETTGQIIKIVLETPKVWQKLLFHQQCSEKNAHMKENKLLKIT